MSTRSYQPGDDYDCGIAARTAAGALVAADATPTAVIVRNGVVDAGVAVTVAGLAGIAGAYVASCRLPAGYAAGDSIMLFARATVGGVATGEFRDAFRLVGYPNDAVVASHVTGDVGGVVHGVATPVVVAGGTINSVASVINPVTASSVTGPVVASTVTGGVAGTVGAVAASVRVAGGTVDATTAVTNPVTASSVAGNVGGNVMGKVLGGGSATIAGVGVMLGPVDVASVSGQPILPGAGFPLVDTQGRVVSSTVSGWALPLHFDLLGIDGTGAFSAHALANAPAGPGGGGAGDVESISGVVVPAGRGLPLVDADGIASVRVVGYAYNQSPGEQLLLHPENKVATTTDGYVLPVLDLTGVTVGGVVGGGTVGGPAGGGGVVSYPVLNRVVINHDYGWPGALSYVVAEDGSTVGDGRVRAYARDAFDAGSRGPDAVAAEVLTDSAGSWRTPMVLAPGTYVLVYFKDGYPLTQLKTVLVEA